MFPRIYKIKFSKMKPTVSRYLVNIKVPKFTVQVYVDTVNTAQLPGKFQFLFSNMQRFLTHKSENRFTKTHLVCVFCWREYTFL